MNNTHIPHDALLPFRDKWQVTINLLAKYLEVSSALILHIHEGKIEVFVTSNTKRNPYKAKQKLSMGKGRYCETVIKTNKILNIPNALKDKKWKNPDYADYTDHNKREALKVLEKLMEGSPLPKKMELLTSFSKKFN